MSWFDNFKKWFWGDLKPELQNEPVERVQPKVPTTTDEVLEEEVKEKPKRRYTKTGSEKPKVVEKKETTKKKKPRKSRKSKKETGE